MFSESDRRGIESDYNPGHIKDVGSELWRSLSIALGEKVTKNNLHGVLKRTAQRQKDTNASSSLNFQPFTNYTNWGEAIDVSQFYGRTTELETFNQWIVRDRCRVVTLLGMGGMGKTALSVKLAEQRQGEFEYVIWRSLRHAPFFYDLMTDCIKIFSHQQVTTLPTSPDEQITFFNDSAYSREEIMSWCESQFAVDYVFGLAINCRGSILDSSPLKICCN
ncbi:NB-ARC domain-containing protein [Nostoc sp. NZL]|uniref:NB-ARC domain-containing protein n=1 Tax=Nostoc sp. NZL TaxID=2650612 RepID=UPI0018C7DCD3|nr:NB-ARC domain-containing protein [Nostoc sp. NZL]MBG1242072.1 hypothetical protein [Nostoc sp. NZL]